MTILRSSDTLSAVRAKTSEPIAENGVLEPRTPLKTLDAIRQVSNTTTPTSSSPDLTFGSLLGLESGTGTIVFLDAGNVRRRSARLAKNLGMIKCQEDIEVVSRKRKKVESEGGGYSSDDESDVRNLERPILNLELGVEKSGGIPDCSTTGFCLHNLDEVVDELVVDAEEVNNVGVVPKMVLDNNVRLAEGEAVNNSKQLRKFCVDMKELGSELSAKKEVEEWFLTLRSGKNIVKRETKANTYAGNLLGGKGNSKESEIELSSNIQKIRSRVRGKEDKNEGCSEGELTRSKKGKGKDGQETLLIGRSLFVNPNVEHQARLLIGASSSDAFYLPKSSDSDEVFEENSAVRTGTIMKTRGKFSKAEKGKRKKDDKNVVDNDIKTTHLPVETVNGSSSSDAAYNEENAAVQDRLQLTETDVSVIDGRRVNRERFRNIARRIASRFAHFSSHDELGDHSYDAERKQIQPPEADSGTDDWPGPFSTAMKIIKDRKMSKREGPHTASTDKNESPDLPWVPRNLEKLRCPKKLAPSLQDLCLSILARNADAITSLDCVPDVLRHKICWFLCDRRQMDSHFLELLVRESPTEICIKDCSWLSEELFSKTFERCEVRKLQVLQLDQCGACIPDYALSATFARSPYGLPALTAISLKGAYRLSDAGLSTLVSSAPSLKSIDLSECSLVTSEGICFLSNSLKLVLRELYIDHCHGVDAMLCLPALLELVNLEVLSVAGIENVCDDFVIEVVSVHGCRIKHLGLADCMELTDYSLEVIGNTCSGLRALDLSNLCKLSDVSIGHMANGCQEIQMLRFCRNSFSDEAVAAYIDIRGAFLKDLSLNNVIKVSNNTALAVSKNCRNLLNLDLSWCRNMTNEALGLIVDSCLSLEVLKLFGCTQVTNVFLDGHSNPQVEIIGLKLTPVFKNISVPHFLRGPLRY